MEVLFINNQSNKKSDVIINEQIRAKELLVISETGEKLGSLPLKEALVKAYEADLDLVLVSENPAVAKLMDYSKYRFEQQKKLKLMKKNQKIVVLQEIQLSPTIEKHDFDTKLRKAISILEKGNKLRIRIRLLGRMIAHQDKAKEVILKFVEALKDYATLESDVKLESRILFAVVSPNKDIKKGA